MQRQHPSIPGRRARARRGPALSRTPDLSPGTGEIRSKDTAADWVLPRLPAEDRAVLERARAIYLGDEPDTWDDVMPAVHAHAAHVVQAIRALARTA